MNDVIQKRIEEFAQSNTDPVAFYRFLRFEQPDMIDIRKAEDFLIEDYSSKAKTIQIIQAYRVKTDLVNNRPHNGSEPEKPYAVYQKLFPQGKMTSNQFNKIYKLIDCMELSDEIKCSKDAEIVVSQWVSLGETKDNIISLLKMVAANPVMVNFLYRHSVSGKDEKEARAAFMKILKILSRDRRNILDALCLKQNVSAHEFEWKIDKDATATEKGSKHEECKVCGYQKAAVEIPATGTPTDPTPENPGSPQTGDNSMMALWIALLFVSGFGVVSTAVYGKKRKSVK